MPFFKQKEEAQTWTVDPHSHGKIWLSADPNEFLPPVNQLRLVQMRHTNPLDKIHLIYDSVLLSTDSLHALKNFCNIHRIITIDVREVVFPFCGTPEEHALVKCYEDEVRHLDEFGSLAAASDILRFLGPVYRLYGIYSDFDVIIDTSAIPIRDVKIKRPFLLPLKFVGGFSIFDTNWSTYLCNDILAFSANKVETDPLIVEIQRRMIASCAQEGTLNPYRSDMLSDQLIMQKLANHRSNRTVRELRANFIDALKKTVISSVKLQNLIDSVTQKTVMCTTGPHMLTQFFYSKYQSLDQSFMKNFSLAQYDGLNEIALKSQIETSVSDTSFIEGGKRALHKKAIKMDLAATRIQQFFRAPKRRCAESTYLWKRPPKAKKDQSHCVIS